MKGSDLYRRYGDPLQHTHLSTWTVPEDIRRGALPRRIYCHRDLVAPLTHAFCLLITSGHIDELQTWDGCHNIRPIRGREQAFNALMADRKVEEAMDLYSLHAWAYAVDVNAKTNRLGQVPTLSAGFVRCFTDAGFRWGGTFTRRDGMHFELASLPPIT